MGVSYKSLILIDNSRSVGTANFTLCKETAKYICNNGNEADEYRIATFGNEVSYISEYSSDKDMLVNAIDGLELVDQDTIITDTLVQIIDEWKEQDVACRNIILFTDGEENAPILHENEELYYLLKELNYPVYIVQSVESKSDNAAKNLSAIATLSNGKLFLTEFENSEAASEKILGTKIIDEIEINRTSAKTIEAEDTNAAKESEVTTAMSESVADEYDEADSMYIANDAAITSESAISEHSDEDYYIDATLTQAEAGTIFKDIKSDADYDTGVNMLIPFIGLIGALVFAGIMFVIYRHNNRIPSGDKRLLDGIKREVDIESEIAEIAEDYDCETRPLYEEDYCRTRLLSPDNTGYSIVLEDCNDPTRLFRACADEQLIVGRSKSRCDVVIDYDDSVSGRHCELTVKDSSWYVRDLKSSNGTKVNGQKVFQEYMLSSGDILQLGQLALQVRL